MSKFEFDDSKEHDCETCGATATYRCPKCGDYLCADCMHFPCGESGHYDE